MGLNIGVFVAIRGIWIHWNPQEVEKIVVNERLNRSEGHVNFSFEVGTFEKNHKPKEGLFFTNPAIQKTISENNVRDGHPVGTIGIYLNHSDKLVVTQDYFRFGGIDYLFRKKLVASFGELKIKEMLAKRFPDYGCSSVPYPEPARAKQLESRGRFPGHAMPIKEDVLILRDYVRKRMREDFFRRHPVSRMRKAGRFVGRILRRQK